MVLSLHSYSFDYIYGYTPNAALFGNQWSMNTQVLGIHGKDGMDVSGVIYEYEVEKNLDDDFVVTVQNENAAGDGYVFQDTEDWSQKYGMRIRKTVPMGYTPLAAFGKGEIATTGTGNIKDPMVLYLYRFDPCFNPQISSECAGYVEPVPIVPEVKLYDALADKNVEDATKETDSDLFDEEREQADDNEKTEEENERLQMAFFQSNHALMLVNEFTQDSLINSINGVTDMASYYVASIPSNVYRETTAMGDTGIKENRRAWRSLSTDNQHYKMVKEQYAKN